MSLTTSHVRTVHARIPKMTDVEVHVSEVVTTEHGTYVDVREFVVSMEQYGRGITIPWDASNLDEIISALQSIRGPQ